MIPYNGIVTKEFLLGNMVLFVCDTQDETRGLIKSLEDIGFEWSYNNDEYKKKAATKGLFCKNGYLYSGPQDDSYYQKAFSCKPYQLKEARRPEDINPVSTTFNELAIKVDAQSREIVELKELCRQQHQMIEQIYKDQYRTVGFKLGDK